MKKISFILCIAFLLTACATYKKLDLSRLTFGMTTEQVIKAAGKPNRVLSVRQTSDGYQEVLEYRTAYDEVYALEFWNDYLTGYEYLYDDVTYVAPLYPPMHYPEFGRPIYIINNRPPHRPNRPNHPDRPTTQPSKPSKPDRPSGSNKPSRPNRPESGRPSGNSRPSQSHTPDRSTMTRPAEVTSRPPVVRK
jgi:hypothetical protein